MLETPTLNLLERALDYASVRQEALSNNIANINTPGYQRKEASFASVLAYAQNENGARQAGINNSTRDFFGASEGGRSSIDLFQTDEGSVRVDQNNVDMDAEMGRLAQNQVYYETCTQLVGSQFSNLKSVIEGR
jgi:flagellar basal-body rod protein FlgB